MIYLTPSLMFKKIAESKSSAVLDPQTIMNNQKKDMLANLFSGGAVAIMPKLNLILLQQVMY